MSDLESIQTAVGRAANRRRWLRAWHGLWTGLLAGASLWLVALTAYKLFPIPSGILPAAAGIAIFLMVTGFIRGALRPMSLLETARWIDEQQKLEERLSTALELSNHPAQSNWKTLLVADAAKHVVGGDAHVKGKGRRGRSRCGRCRRLREGGGYSKSACDGSTHN